MMEALEAGAEDFNVEDEYFEILTGPEVFSQVREAMEKKGYAIDDAEVRMIPKTMTALTDPKQIEFMDRLIESLDDLYNVQNVHSPSG